jgi:cytochrome oxidase Cu insertion factor (SCO1/SenC/PrrC family)
VKRTRRLALAALAAAGAGAAVAALWNPPGPPALEINPQQLERARMMEALMVGRGPIGGSFTLTAHDGTRRALSDFRGKVVLLYFGYTQCPDVCPTDLVQIAALLHSLGERAAEVQALYVTVDPERDTAALLAAYLPAFDPRILGLTGGVEEIGELASRYKAYFAKVPLAGGYLMEHSANFYVLDRSGRFAASLPPGTKADRLADVVRERLG